MSEPKSFVVCESCKADGFFERQRAECGGCGSRRWLCPTCFALYTVCSDACREKWRASNQHWMEKPLEPETKRRRKRADDGQADLFRVG